MWPMISEWQECHEVKHYVSAWAYGTFTRNELISGTINLVRSLKV